MELVKILLIIYLVGHPALKDNLYIPQTPTTPSVQASVIEFKATPKPQATTNAYLIQINIERAKRNLPQLSELGKLDKGAGLRAKDLVSKGQWSHDGYVEAITSSGIKSGKIGENLARNYSSVDQVIGAWINSPEHARIMFDPPFKYAGVGVYKNYVVLWLSTNN